MSLSDIAQITISSNSRGIDRRSFGTPMVAGPLTFNDGARAKVFDLATVTEDLPLVSSVVIGDPTYTTLQALAAQVRKPPRVVVGALTDTAVEQIFTLQVLQTVAGDYAVTLQEGAATARTFTYTSPGGETASQIATSLAALIAADPGITSAVAATDTITVTVDSTGALGGYENIVGFDPIKFAYTDTTAVHSLIADLDAIRAENDTWYLLLLARPLGGAGAVTLGGWVETKDKIAGLTTFDTGAEAATSTDTGALLEAQTLLRTFAFYTRTHSNRTAAATASLLLSFDPGSVNWAFKGLSGVVADTFSANAEANLDAKNLNRYVEVAGLGVTQWGTMAGGEWIDTVRGRDWLKVRMQERIFALLANAPKVPYTQAGIDAIVAQVEAQLREGISAGYLSGDPLPGQEVPFIVTAPRIADVPTADKTSRILRNVSFTAQLAGAINKVVINGVIQV